MKEIEEEYAGKVKVVFYDVWTAEGKPYGKKYGIRRHPDAGVPRQGRQGVLPARGILPEGRARQGAEAEGRLTMMSLFDRLTGALQADASHRACRVDGVGRLEHSPQPVPPLEHSAHRGVHRRAGSRHEEARIRALGALFARDPRDDRRDRRRHRDDGPPHGGRRKGGNLFRRRDLPGDRPASARGHHDSVSRRRESAEDEEEGSPRRSRHRARVRRRARSLHLRVHGADAGNRLQRGLDEAALRRLARSLLRDRPLRRDRAGGDLHEHGAEVSQLERAIEGSRHSQEGMRGSRHTRRASISCGACAERIESAASPLDPDGSPKGADQWPSKRASPRSRRA